MEIELEGQSIILTAIILLVVILFALGMLGKIVTPVSAGELRFLNPSRWTSYKLQRVAHKETKTLVKDALNLRRILAADTPDPVEAMLLAQDIYAKYQTGSSATASARYALIAAAEATVKATTGEIDRNEAIAVYTEAQNRIEALTNAEKSMEKRIESEKVLMLYTLYTPIVRSP